MSNESLRIFWNSAFNSKVRNCLPSPLVSRNLISFNFLFSAHVILDRKKDKDTWLKIFFDIVMFIFIEISSCFLLLSETFSNYSKLLLNIDKILLKLHG